MNSLKFLFLLSLLTQPIFAQKKTINEFAVIDKKALQLPDSLAKTTDLIASYINANFKTEKEKSRAIFIWVASNIQFDVENMFAINLYEKREDKITKTLTTRKGICENYASLFAEICSKSGMKSFVVEGYTKQNGFTDYIPHAWNATIIDNNWFLFDPTWGSGYINGGKFFSKINNAYFMSKPESLIKSHIPFDYLWQFLYYPVTNQEFYEGRTEENKNKPFFQFNDSIQVYEKLNHTDQLISAAYRIEKNGIKNAMIFDRLRHLKMEIENDKQTKIINLYNSAVVDYNAGVNDFNRFIDYRNKQFTPVKTDPEIQAMLDTPDNELKLAKTKLTQIKNPDANTTNLIAQLAKSIDDALDHVTEQQDWLRTYFSKNKLGRKNMFYGKVTWFGIPLN